MKFYFSIFVKKATTSVDYKIKTKFKKLQQNSCFYFYKCALFMCFIDLYLFQLPAIPTYNDSLFFSQKYNNRITGEHINRRRS